MLTTIDLIIIEGFLDTQINIFNEFCINDCIGTKGTAPATLKHVRDELSASRSGVEADAEGCARCGESFDKHCVIGHRCVGYKARTATWLNVSCRTWQRNLNGKEA